MDNTKEDRRIRRTKRTLKHALTQLMYEKEFKDITVKDITERADLNRGTFYLHYTDTYDILNKIENEILENIQKMVDEYFKTSYDGNDTVSLLLKPVAEYIAENADVCRCFINNKASSDFIEKLQNLIFSNCSNIIKRKHGFKESDNYNYYLSFVTYGIIGVLKKWLETVETAGTQNIVELVDRVVNLSIVAVK